ncbi:MAG: hypothetical protein U0934_02790 [Pseudotabrizicola sp.]|uniref:hypothetical protein n=1 Tax=Pseudotabrizicola sp. TaxID=2939647 RepID=UPI00273202CA|nr:hypothetical protein [Pseudotabrizicola sp.]MDP2083484.1 hypothetical protein [Pseudotabrizicola sp.]MDZ7572869.1 hypothetical protein [Pseudotabrizicola sp.]
MREKRFKLFADYFQFYLQDEGSKGIKGESWTPEAHQRRLALERCAFAVMTARNMDVPVIVRLYQDQPEIDLAAWDHIVEFSIDVPSGRLVVAGCTDSFPQAERIELEKGSYRVRVCQAGLDEISDDGLDGKDHYLVQTWRGTFMQVNIIKQYSEE